MTDEVITIEITGREVSLILNYGYPFPEQAELLRPISEKPGWHEVSIEKYWLELIIGDLSRSIKEVPDYNLQDELDALCHSLEIAVQSEKTLYVEKVGPHDKSAADEAQTEAS